MEQQGIERIDRNLQVDATVNDPDIVWHDVREAPFRVYGLYDYREQAVFCRMPQEVAHAVSEGVETLARSTAGGRVRFSTDADRIAIRALMPKICRMPHMALTGSVGFDLYLDDPKSGVSRFVRAFVPPFHPKDGYESLIALPSRKLRHFTIHFPLYSDVAALSVGLPKGATLGEGLTYRAELPVVYYGSSITQGGCASRPGNAYQNIVSRHLGLDHINLGFSGSGRGEDAMIDYLASLSMCAFVSDYDHNAHDAAHLERTHYKLYAAIRKAHPSIPYIMLSKCDFDSDYEANVCRRNVVFDTYRRAWADGDRNVYYIDGASIFRGQELDSCTVDGTHPTDHGFVLMANAVEAELKRALTQGLLL